MMLDDMPERLIQRDGSYTYSNVRDGSNVHDNPFVFTDLPEGLIPDEDDHLRFTIYRPHVLTAEEITLTQTYWRWHYEDAATVKHTPWKPCIEDGFGMYLDNWFNAFVFKHAGFRMAHNNAPRYRYGAPYIQFYIKQTKHARRVIDALDRWENGAVVEADHAAYGARVGGCYGRACTPTRTVPIAAISTRMLWMLSHTCTARGSTTTALRAPWRLED